MLIHVNRSFISKNTQDGGNRPVYTVKDRGRTRYARSVKINGPCELVYSGERLACGARAWIAVDDDVEVILNDEMTFAEAKTAA